MFKPSTTATAAGGVVMEKKMRGNDKSKPAVLFFFLPLRYTYYAAKYYDS
jgi:hypothetical protein